MVPRRHRRASRRTRRAPSRLGFNAIDASQRACSRAARPGGAAQRRSAAAVRRVRASDQPQPGRDRRRRLAVDRRRDLHALVPARAVPGAGPVRPARAGRGGGRGGRGRAARRAAAGPLRRLLLRGRGRRRRRAGRDRCSATPTRGCTGSGPRCRRPRPPRTPGTSCARASRRCASDRVGSGSTASTSASRCARSWSPRRCSGSSSGIGAASCEVAEREERRKSCRSSIQSRPRRRPRHGGDGQAAPARARGAGPRVLHRRRVGAADRGRRRPGGDLPRHGEPGRPVHVHPARDHARPVRGRLRGDEPPRHQRGRVLRVRRAWSRQGPGASARRSWR